MKTTTLLFIFTVIFIFNTFSQETETVTFTYTPAGAAKSKPDSTKIVSKSKLNSNSWVRVRNGIDTTNTIFKEIFQFWEDYRTALYRSIVLKDQFINLKKYWANSEIEEYKSPDLILDLPSMYYQSSEYLLGIEKRNDTLYELKSVFYFNMPKPEIDISFSIFIAKTSAGYKLFNKHTFNRASLNNKDINWIQFYYPNTYNLNTNEATQLFQRADKLALEWGLRNITPIKYYIFPTYTDILNCLGVNIGLDDFISTNVVTERGFALTKSRQVFYTQNGENKLHEFIHILIADLKHNYEYTNFDEGVCCYFGDHAGESYNFHAKRLKEFLNNNPQINLGVSLVSAYKDNNGKYTHDTIWKTGLFDEGGWYTDDTTTNYMYMIMGTICEIAYKKKGMDIVKQMVLEAKNGDEMYTVIEKYLGIKRKNINTYIRDYLNTNY